MSEEDRENTGQSMPRLRDLLWLHQPGEGGIGGAFLHVIRVLIWLVVTIVWAVVGFALWVPFLARMMASYSGAVISVSYGYGDLRPAQHALEFAMHFWTRGFVQANVILRGVPLGNGLPIAVEPEIAWRRTFALLGNLVYTVAFWLLLILVWYVLVYGWRGTLMHFRGIVSG